MDVARLKTKPCAEYGLVMVSTGIMQRKKQAAGDALNSKIKIKR